MAKTKFCDKNTYIMKLTIKWHIRYDTFVCFCQIWLNIGHDLEKKSSAVFKQSENWWVWTRGALTFRMYVFQSMESCVWKISKGHSAFIHVVSWVVTTCKRKLEDPMSCKKQSRKLEDLTRCIKAKHSLASNHFWSWPRCLCWYLSLLHFFLSTLSIIRPLLLNCLSWFP